MGGGFEWGLPAIRVSNSPTQLPPTPTAMQDDREDGDAWKLQAAATGSRLLRCIRYWGREYF